MLRVPFTIANNSISFYAKGRMHSVTQADPAAYAGLRAALQTPQDQPHDIDTLLGFVDVRQALMNQSRGRIVFIGEDIVFNGEVQHGLWVDKILQFRAAGEPFDPIWNALDRLLHNPTPEAITRLPIFLERTGLGFLPDGRFIAFKGVDADLRSGRANLDGTYFTHEIGAKPRMRRDEVDADPNQTCSHGLHVGAPGYVKQHYSGARHALVLVAVDPVDVVCVPTDYNGEKMRVCGYEVIDHLDQSYSDELLGRLKTTVTGYSQAPMPVSGFTTANTLTDAEEADLDQGLAEQAAGNADTVDTVLQVGHFVAGWQVKQIDHGTRTFRAGLRWRSFDTVTEINNLVGNVIWTRPDASPLTSGSTETAVLPALTAEVGDLVVCHTWPPAGTYPVVSVNEGAEYRLTLATEHDGLQGVLNRYVTEVIPRPWMRAEIGGYVTVEAVQDSYIPAGRYQVTDTTPTTSTVHQFQVRRPDGNGNWWIDATRVTATEPKA